MMRFVPILLTFLLTACASTPDPQIHSYFLEIEDVTPSVVEGDIIDIKIQVARYLAQPGIVLQTGPNQLTAAHYHRWAEPLSEGIRRVLAKQLHVNSAVGSGMAVSVNIYRFHGTRDGVALAAGHWSIYDVQNKRTLHQQTFDLKQPLGRAGYEALVQALGTLLDQIGRDIEHYLKSSG